MTLAIVLSFPKFLTLILFSGIAGWLIGRVVEMEIEQRREESFSVPVRKGGDEISTRPAASRTLRTRPKSVAEFYEAAYAQFLESNPTPEEVWSFRLGMDAWYSLYTAKLDQIRAMIDYCPTALSEDNVRDIQYELREIVDELDPRKVQWPVSKGGAA